MATNIYAPSEPLLGSTSASDSGITQCPPPTYGSMSTPPAKGDCHIDVCPAQDELDDVEGQGGVQQADAVNLVWTRGALIVAYCL